MRILNCDFSVNIWEELQAGEKDIMQQELNISILRINTDKPAVLQMKHKNDIHI